MAALLLTLLAGRALDQDGNLTVQTGVASNGFGLVGRVVGMASGDRNFAARLGFYAAALSSYQNFLRNGRDVIFPRNTASRSKQRRCERLSSNRRRSKPRERFFKIITVADISVSDI